MLKTKKIAYIGMLTAMIIVLSRFLSFKYNLVPGSTYSLKIDPGYIFLIISGALFGPVAGAVTGLISDVLGFFVGKTIGEPGAFFPGFTITYIFVGTMGGIITKVIKEKWVLFIPFAMLVFVLASILNTTWLWLGFGMPFKLLIIPKTVTAIILSIPFSILSNYLLKISDKIVKL